MFLRRVTSKNTQKTCDTPPSPHLRKSACRPSTLECGCEGEGNLLHHQARGNSAACHSKPESLNPKPRFTSCAGSSRPVCGGHRHRFAASSFPLSKASLRILCRVEQACLWRSSPPLRCIKLSSVIFGQPDHATLAATGKWPVQPSWNNKHAFVPGLDGPAQT